MVARSRLSIAAAPAGLELAAAEGEMAELEGGIGREGRLRLGAGLGDAAHVEEQRGVVSPGRPDPRVEGDGAQIGRLRLAFGPRARPGAGRGCPRGRNRRGRLQRPLQVDERALQVAGEAWPPGAEARAESASGSSRGSSATARSAAARAAS